jgi:hypothetical protein
MALFIRALLVKKYETYESIKICIILLHPPIYFIYTFIYCNYHAKKPNTIGKGFFDGCPIHGVDLHQKSLQNHTEFLFYCENGEFLYFVCYIPYFFIFRTRVEWSTSKCFAVSLMDLYLDRANLIILISVFSRSCFSGITSFEG